jgi:hypothetical protein
MDVHKTFRHVFPEGRVLEKSQLASRSKSGIYPVIQNPSGFIFLKDVIAFKTRIPA